METPENAAPAQGVDEAPPLRLGRKALSLIGELVLVCGVVAVPLALIYRPWGQRIHTPFNYSGDSFLHALYVKNMTHGWNFAETSNLGAPYGQRNYDLPISSERAHLILSKLIGLFTNSAFTTINLYFLVSFFLIAIAAHLTLRALGLSRLSSGFAAALFPFLPYHFAHSTDHAFLSAYFSVPLGVFLIVWASRGSLPGPVRSVVKDSRGRWIAWISLIVAIVVVGIGSAYYTVFIVLLLAWVGLIRFARTRSWRALVLPFALSVAIALVLAAALLPEIAWRSKHGENQLIGQRSAAESEIYGMHLAQLMAPSYKHRISSFASIGRGVREVPNPGEAGTPIGLVAVAGLGLSMLAVLRRSCGQANGEIEVARVQSHLAIAAIGAFIISTVGGLGMVIAASGFTQIRAWGRMSVVIGFIGLACAAIALERGLGSIRSATVPRFVRVGATCALLVIGLADQSPANVTQKFAANEAAHRADLGFVRNMNSELPTNAMVFQLPVMTFPESGLIGRTGGYDPLSGYLNDEGSLRWSYGGARGRESDWQQSWSTQPTHIQVGGLAAVGFDALYVDRFGYADNGAALEAEIQQVAGLPRFQSSDGRLVWYDLRPLRSTLEKAIGPEAIEQLVGIERPITANFTAGAPGFVGSEGWLSNKATLTVADYFGGNDPVRLRFIASGPLGSSLRVLADDLDVTISLEPNGAEIDVTIPLKGSLAAVTLSTDAPQVVAPGDPRKIFIHLNSLNVVEASLKPTLTSLAKAMEAIASETPAIAPSL